MVSQKDIEVHKEENRTKKNSHKQDPKYDQRNQLTHVGTCLNLHAIEEQDKFINSTLSGTTSNIHIFSVCSMHKA